METKGFIKFDEMKIRGRHLKEIPSDQAAMLSLLLCAYNELNTLLRLYCLNAREVDAPKPAQLVAQGTKMFLARTLSSKLFEVVELLRGKKSWQKTLDPIVKEIAAQRLERFDELAAEGGHDIARTLRDDCTNHYSLTATKKNISGMDDDADLTLYLHKNEGNSFALAGERVVFEERFRTGRLPRSSVEEKTHLQVWLDWTIHALQWVKDTCAEFLFLVLPDHVVKKVKWNQMYWPELNLFGEMGKVHAPVFLHESRT